MNSFDATEVVMDAMKKTEEFLRLRYENSLRTGSKRGFVARHAYLLNNILHKLNLHFTTYTKMRSVEEWQPDTHGAYVCCGTIRAVLEKPELFEQVHSMLQDLESQQCLEWVLKYRTARALAGPLANSVFPPQHSEKDYLEAIDRLVKRGIFKSLGLSVALAVGAVTNTFAFEQYALAGTVEVDLDDVVLDVGAFIGDTAVWFAQKGASAVYAFEPDPVNVQRLQRVITRTKLGSRVIPVSSALGSECGKVKFKAGGTGDSTVAQEGVEVRVTTIDNFVQEENLQRVDFIKMDIEGLELQALKGATETIKRFRPKLAICVYHRPEDLVEIPLFLKELLPDAKFYLSHKFYSWNETVLFVNPRVS